MAKNRRGNDEGGIRQRTDGRWEGALSLGIDLLGKRRRKFVYGESKKDVQEQLAKLVLNPPKDEDLEPHRMTLIAYLHRWLEDSARPTIRKNTYISYERTVRLYINKYIGTLQLMKVTPFVLQAFYAKLEREGATPRQRQLVHSVLHRAFVKAIRMGVMPINPCDAIDRPRCTSKEVKPLMPDEVKRFLKAAEEDRLYALYVLAITTGLRFGELLGLQWENVDLATGQVMVAKTLLEIGGVLEIGETKTKKSRRRIKLSSFALKALVDHRKQTLAEGIISPWVFCNTQGGPHRQSNLRLRSFKPILKKAGLPDMRFHDLRHQAATIMLSQNINPKIIQETLGHSSISVTLDIYSHLMPSMQNEVAEKVGEFFSDLGL